MSRAYPKTFKEWLTKNLDSTQIRDLAEHGADAGWPGLTYYKDTCKLYERYRGEIWDALENLRDNLGAKSIMEVIASFNSAGDIGTPDQFENALVWFMAEECARELSE